MIKLCGGISTAIERIKVLSTAAFLLIVSCQSCGPITDIRDFADADLFPPVIENIRPLDTQRIQLDFNEPVSLGPNILITPELGSISVEASCNSLILEVSEKQSAGIHYTIEAEANDETGNRTGFLVPFYGYNSDLPELLINEFTTQGSSTHPDVIELLIRSEGNTAGIWIVEGTTDHPEQSITLPSCRVENGDYILVHFKPQGIPEEINETETRLDISEGYNASPDARDFWVEGGTGLSGNNGVLAVYECPGGDLIDAVLYSNRTSSSDEKYSGFGSTTMLEKAVQIVEQKGWIGSGDGGAPRPEDGINPDDSTATRSICRGSIPEDSNCAADWHIVPTSSYSFGSLNTDEIYQPD